MIECYCHACAHEWEVTDDCAEAYACPQCGGKHIFRARYINCECCGERVYLTSRNSYNECDCGAAYNAFGQLLAPADEWNEDERRDFFYPSPLDY